MKRLAIVLLGLSACGGDGNKSTNPDLSAPASQTVGASGGTVSAAGGGSVQIPAGALTSDVAITATPAPSAPAPASQTVVGTAVIFGPEGQQFSSPVTITLPIDSAKLGQKTASDVSMFTAPAGSSSYTKLTTTVVDSTHVSAQVSHFSTFTLGIPGAGCATNQDCQAGQVCVAGACSI